MARTRVALARAPGQDETLLTTADEVAAWFADAGYVVRADLLVRLKGAIIGGIEFEDADVEIVANIANLVNMMRELWKFEKKYYSGDDAARRVAYGKARSIQIALRDLRLHLPWLLEQNGWRVREEPQLPEAGHLRQLIDLLDALFVEAPYLFDPSSRGGSRRKDGTYPLSRKHIDALVGPIKEALRSAGLREPSPRPDGALVKVLCRALTAIDGEDHKPGTVTSGLKRDRRQRAVAT